MRRLIGSVVLAAFVVGFATGAFWCRARHRGDPKPEGPSPADSARISAFQDRTRLGHADVVFLGDSLTDYWSDYPHLWQKYFSKWRAANFGVGSDGLANVAWIAENSGLQQLSPRVVVILAGTNDIFRETPNGATNRARRIYQIVRNAAPHARIVHIAVFPRRKEGSDINERITALNHAFSEAANEDGVRFLDLGPLLAPNGTPTSAIMPDGLHLSAEGYRIWGDTLTSILHEMMP